MEGLTLGSYDILHYGHVDFLKKAAELCTGLVVAVNTDEFIAEFKPNPPVMSLEERMYAVGQLGFSVIPNPSAGREVIEQVKPDIIVVGSDWARKDYLKQIDVTQDWLDERNIALAYIPYMQKYPISSTEIKRRVRFNVREAQN